jgi:serine/threonine-protein kinase
MQAGQELGPFTVEKEIGSGAMGTVYRGRYTESGQAVAVKIINSGADAHPTALARFEREANILKKLKHPNIVRLHATGRHRKTPFYVMEFVDGESLETLLQRRGRFTWEETVTIGQQVCAALKHAHGEGIIHRDLKPANIMMTPDGTVKLTDFGIAKGLESVHLTATNCTVGTASYMSPEQCRGEPNLTNKSDLYSLGVVFYELLTGERPFVAETTLKMFLAHTEGKFERPSRRVMDIPVWLDTLVCQLMEKDPGKRPLDAEIVSRSLQEITDKIAAQRSAGVDIVTARRMDVPRDRRPKSEADREAARTLRDAAAKKKTKRKTRPLYERAWVQAVGIIAVLAAIGGMVWYVTRPPSPEVLYEQALALMSKENPDDWDAAHDGPIKTFLKHYGDQTDGRAAKMQEWSDQAAVALLERQMQKRMNAKLNPQDENESAVLNALRSEETGELDAAAQRWQQLLHYKDEKDENLRRWGQIAVKHLNEIEAVGQRERQLAEQAPKMRGPLPAVESAHPMTLNALLAVRAEAFGDYSMALDRWRVVRDVAGTNSDGRVLQLLGAKKISELGPTAPRGPDSAVARKERIESKLRAAEELSGRRPSEARAIYRDIIFLYSGFNDPDIKPLVENAQTRLSEIAPD